MNMEKLMKTKTTGWQGSAALGPAEQTVLLVPECNSSEELAEFGTALVSLLAKNPKQITLRFVGVHQMGTDGALVIHDILKEKSPGTLLITEAWSSLMNGSVFDTPIQALWV